MESGCIEDEEFSAPSPKRKRLSGAATYGSKFKKDWAAEFPCVQEGREDPMYSFYCLVCKKDVSCRHQGIADVRRHVGSRSHTSMVTSVSTSNRLTNMGFVPVGSEVAKKVS